MSESKEHKSFLGALRGVFVEDIPEEEHETHISIKDGPKVPPSAPRGGGDDVDQMFADIEAQVTGKPAAAPGKVANPAAQPPVQQTKAPGPSPSVIEGDVITPDVKRVLKLLNALPPVLTKEQVQPVLRATIEAANLNADAVALEAVTSRGRAEQGIAAANTEIERLESEREQTLARLEKLMEAAREQCAQGVAAQQTRSAQYAEAIQTLARVCEYLPSPTNAPTSAKPTGTMPTIPNAGSEKSV